MGLLDHNDKIYRIEDRGVFQTDATKADFIYF